VTVRGTNLTGSSIAPWEGRSGHVPSTSRVIKLLGVFSMEASRRPVARVMVWLITASAISSTARFNKTVSQALASGGQISLSRWWRRYPNEPAGLPANSTGREKGEGEGGGVSGAEGDPQIIAPMAPIQPPPSKVDEADSSEGTGNCLGAPFPLSTVTEWMQGLGGFRCTCCLCSGCPTRGGWT
jgi:hypothetical protein